MGIFDKIGHSFDSMSAQQQKMQKME
jgi:hypothetical protein